MAEPAKRYQDMVAMVERMAAKIMALPKEKRSYTG